MRTLRQEGFEALWAGGCVRDQVLGTTPKDYDIASTATPDDVIRIFGRRRTVAVGASFGVVMVLGPDRSAGQIEVATFRIDGEYLDGRRPGSVIFCRPEEDAKRRDFTINGMFFDPLDHTLIDYVGGREDLALGIVRAIGDPVARFTEDKLRMLRAIRFTATFGFILDEATADAVYQLRQQLNQVSAERIAQELKRMLSHASRAHAFRLLQQTGLLPEALPELYRGNYGSTNEVILTIVGQTLTPLKSEQFEPAMALILRSLCHAGKGEPGGVSLMSLGLESSRHFPSAVALKIAENADGTRSVPATIDVNQVPFGASQRTLPSPTPKSMYPGTGGKPTAAAASVCRRLKLSNEETECICWLVESLPVLDDIRSRPLRIRKPLLAHPHFELLLQMSAAVAAAENRPATDVEFCRDYMSTLHGDELCPPPLVDGQDLIALNVPQGPAFRILLSTIRDEQLDEILTTRITALERLLELVNASTVG